MMGLIFTASTLEMPSNDHLTHFSIIYRMIYEYFSCTIYLEICHDICCFLFFAVISHLVRYWYLIMPVFIIFSFVDSRGLYNDLETV